MDRVIVGRKFMKDFSPLSRNELQLTATTRHAGEYTGMDIVESGDLQFVVCAGQLSQNIGKLLKEERLSWRLILRNDRSISSTSIR